MARRSRESCGPDRHETCRRSSRSAEPMRTFARPSRRVLQPRRRVSLQNTPTMQSYIMIARRTLIAAGITALAFANSPAFAQDTTATRGGRGGRGDGRPAVVITDTARARALFVSKDPKDLRGCGAQCA